jgi:two-component sensor histidine kinase
VKLEISGDEISLESDTATTIALVVNELIQNSIKHAFKNRDKGKISVAIEKGVVYSIITIADDGVGFTEPVDHNRLGLKLVRSLLKDKLKGEMDLSSSDRGTKIHLTFINSNNY